MFDYNEFYKTQDPNFCDDPDRHIFTASLIRGRVADVGCCFGILSDYYFGQYTGFDVAPYAIEKAAEIRRKDAQFLIHDCSDLDGLDIENFDTFVFANFLEHFENDEKIFEPLFKRHKKGTRIVIVVPNADRVPDPSHLRTLTIPGLRKKFSPYGKVKFYNWSGAKKHIICTVDLDERNDNLLSLVMIVKNEEKGLERALLSCVDFVDEIFISVDNNSSDKTEKIAEIYADNLKRHYWQDDFSAARNAAHAGVKTKWILFLDGHEYLEKFDGFGDLAGSSAEGLLCSVQLDSGTIFRYPRIYKNGCRFEGQVHNKIVCKGEEYFPGILIKHDRLGAQSAASAAERKKQQDEMIPRIMGAELKNNPQNIRALFHLALHYHARGDFKKAISFQKKYLKYSKLKGERWLVTFNKSLCNLGQKKYFFALWNADKAEEEISGRWEIAKLKGVIFAAQKNYSKALEFLVKSFDENPYEFSYKPWARDNVNTWNLIGECFFNLKEFPKAYTAFDRAAEICEDPDGKKFLAARAKLMSEMSASQYYKKPR